MASKKQTLGLIMAFGVGVLISAVAYELVEEAFHTHASSFSLVSGLLAGALTFFVGDIIIARLGGRRTKGSYKKTSQNSGLTILLGTILDGIPESMVIGLTILSGNGVSIAMVVAVFVSNIPEAVGATASLLGAGWKRRRIFGLWCTVTIISGFAALAGYMIFAHASAEWVAFTLCFAGGALLTMLANSMMPDAYRDSGKWAGLLTTLGFGLAFALSLLG